MIKIGYAVSNLAIIVHIWLCQLFLNSAAKAERPGRFNGGKFPRTQLFGKQERQLSTKRAGIHLRRSRTARWKKNRDFSAQRKIT